MIARNWLGFGATFLKWGLVSALMLGIILPRMSAVLVDLLPNVHTMIICTGDGLVVWTIGPDGQPIELSESDSHHCVITDEAKRPPVIPPFWAVLARDYQFGFSIREDRGANWDARLDVTPVRGPPVHG